MSKAKGQGLKAEAGKAEHMVSIILSASPEVWEAAKAHGFVEAKVLIRQEAGPSNSETRRKAERQLFALGADQFIVSDFWGRANE